MAEADSPWKRSPSKVGACTAKLASTALLSLVSALLLKTGLAPDAATWTDAFEALPAWALALMLIIVPLAWLLVDFLAAVFLEVRRQVLEEAALHFAVKLTRVPSAIKSVLSLWADALVVCLSRWKFDGRYRRRIGEECMRLHAQSGLLHASAPLSLDDAYINVAIAATSYAQAEPRLLATSARAGESIYGFLRRQPPGTVLTVYGRPGGGKSTLFRHLALRFAKNQQGRHRLRRRLPVLLELRSVASMFSGSADGRWAQPTLAQVIQEFWAKSDVFADLMKRAPKNWLERHLASGQLLIMLDGFDEVPHGVAGATNSPRRNLAAWINTQVQLEGQRDCRFLLTSRPGGFAEAPVKHVIEVDVQPLTQEQANQFIRAFCVAYQRVAMPAASWKMIESESDRAASTMQTALRARPELFDMRANPLLLHMLCLFHRIRGNLPSDTSQLYKDTCEILADRGLRAPGIVERIRPQDKIAVLRPLADYFMRSGTREPKSASELNSAITIACSMIDFPPGEFLDYISKDTGLIQRIDHDTWDFAHKTFAEYLCAAHWHASPPTDEELESWIDKDWWRVTLTFYSAASDDSPVIRLGLKHRAASAWSLAFHCLNEKHRVSPEVRADATRKLNSALRDPGNVQAFCSAAQALCDLKLREVVPIASSSTLVQRQSLISNAEYQLFLLSAPKDIRELLTPLHWRDRRFKDGPKDPVTGITAVQAIAFVKWLAQTTGTDWKMPTGSVALEINCDYGIWATNDGRCVVAVPAKREQEFKKSVRLIAEALRIAIPGVRAQLDSLEEIIRLVTQHAAASSSVILTHVRDSITRNAEQERRIGVDKESGLGVRVLIEITLIRLVLTGDETIFGAIMPDKEDGGHVVVDVPSLVYHRRGSEALRQIDRYAARVGRMIKNIAGRRATNKRNARSSTRTTTGDGAKRAMAMMRIRSERMVKEDGWSMLMINRSALRAVINREQILDILHDALHMSDRDLITNLVAYGAFLSEAACNALPEAIQTIVDREFLIMKIVEGRRLGVVPSHEGILVVRDA